MVKKMVVALTVGLLLLVGLLGYVLATQRFTLRVSAVTLTVFTDNTFAFSVDATNFMHLVLALMGVLAVVFTCFGYMLHVTTDELAQIRTGVTTNISKSETANELEAT